MKKLKNNSHKSSLIIFFTFLIPFIYLSVGIIIYYITIPNICGKLIPFAVWLFTDSQDILDILQKQNSALFDIRFVIGIRIFWWAWLIGFCSALFFAGRWLQAKPKPNAVNAVLARREPYLRIQNAYDTLKEIKCRLGCKELDGLISAVKRLEERLSIESDFGCGNSAVIDCENSIATQIKLLIDSISHIEDGDLDKNLNHLSEVVAHINSLLRRRTELKKR